MPNMIFKDSNGDVIAEVVDGVLFYEPAGIPVTVIQQSPQGYVGTDAYDADLKHWTLEGKNIRVDGELYHWGWAYDYLMWDDVLWHRNDAGYIHEVTDAQGQFVEWSQPVEDPRTDNGNGNGNGGSMNELRTKGNLQGNILTVNDNPGFKVGDPVIVPATQGRGKRGPGGNYPNRVFNTEAELKNNQGSISEGQIAGALDTGRTWARLHGNFMNVLDNGSWYLGFIVPKAYFATITKIEGNKWTMNKASLLNVNDVDIVYDGSKTIMDALSRGGDINVNRLFPNVKRVAVNGMLGASQKDNAKLTADKRGSFEIYSPLGTPCISMHWRECRKVLSNFITLRGNWGDDGYGLNWADTSTNFYGYHGALTDNNPFTPAWGTSGHEFWGCEDSEHQDADVYNVPNRATGGEGNGNCWSRRIIDHAEFVMRQYIQWQMQYASTTSPCGTEDCEIISKALIPGFEIMHGHGNHIRPKGLNIQLSMNNASGVVDSPDIVLEKDCMVPLENTPAWYQYAPGNGFGVPCINLNCNAGTWAADKGITLINPKVDQSAGWLHPNGVGLVGVEMQDRLQNFQMPQGGTFLYPPKRKQPYDKYSIGANGIKCDAPQALLDGKFTVTGECQNQANNWNVYVSNGRKGSNFSTECPPNSVYFNGQIS